MSCSSKVACAIVVLSAPIVSRAAEPAASPTGPMPVFILAGQSNMAGSGRVEELPAELAGVAPSVLFIKFWETQFKPLDTAKLGKSFGPEITFGREMARVLGRPVGLIKLAVGGTSLEQHWNPTVIDKEKGIGTLYQRFVQYLQSVRKANPDIQIAGMIWMQGEADARYHAKTMEQYREKLEALIDACRQESGQESLPFVCGRVNPPNWPYQKNVRQAQESAQRANYAWIDCDDLGMHDDKLHFNTAGQIELGKRFAEAMAKLINSKTAGR